MDFCTYIVYYRSDDVLAMFYHCDGSVVQRSPRMREIGLDRPKSFTRQKMRVSRVLGDIQMTRFIVGVAWLRTFKAQWS